MDISADWSKFHITLKEPSGTYTFEEIKTSLIQERRSSAFAPPPIPEDNDGIGGSQI
jgi:hypothetical protein